MGIFGEKEIYKYRLLERYKKGVDGCQFVGETSAYRIYTLKHQTLSNTYFLRQEKANPKKVVYLGRAHRNICVFHNKIYSIDRMSLTGRSYHPLFCTDIETGTRTEIAVLSKKQCHVLVPGSLHFYCQDMVESIKISGDAVVIEVNRYKEGVNYEKEFTYYIYIRHNGSSLVIEYDYGSL